jgi:predicted phage terminase large subunit-like protein
MSNLKQKASNPEEIFQTPFWANREGLDAMTSKVNRDEAEAIMLFGQTYFPEHFPSKHPDLHTDMLAIMASKRKRKAIAVPRGHAKSTVVGFLLTLYRICFQQRKFIVIVSDSEDKAKAFVMRIRSELEYNKKLAAAFTQTGSFKSTDWAKTDFATSTKIRILAKGAGQSIRGELYLDTRPDMIVLDDIETDENAGKDEILNYMLTNVIPSVNRMGDYEICYVGTIIKDMSILHQMLINPEWASAKWEALDEHGEMIAPMLLPKSEYESSKRLYQSAGKMSLFYAENHNNPMVADDAMTFKQEYFQPYDELPDNVRYFITYDPAMPPSGRTKIKKVDKSAIVVLATDSYENWYVVKIIANRETPTKNRELLFNLAKKYKPQVVWMETIAAQRAMYLEIKEDMKRNNVKFPLREIPSHSGSKEARIEQLQPLYESGRIYHNPKDTNTQELERELMLFGRTPHDDISDALSFFLNKVTYPKEESKIRRQKVRDAYENFFNDDSNLESWRIL